MIVYPDDGFYLPVGMGFVLGCVVHIEQGRFPFRLLIC